MTTALGIAAVAALILANGYFVAAEFGFVAARRKRLEQAAAAGDRRAGRAVGIMRRLSFMLSGAQFGITATSLVVGFVAEPTIGRALRPVVEAVGFGPRTSAGVALTIAFVLATSTQMVVGELAPKNYAIARPEPTARALAGPTHAFLFVFGPVIRLFDALSNRLLRLLGVEPVEELYGAVSAEELDVILEESARQGSLTARQAGLLERALGFRELRAGDAMVPHNRVVAVSAAAHGADLLSLVARGHTRFPVTSAGGALDDVVGVVNAKDLLELDAAERETVAVATLVRPAVLVPDSLVLPTVLDRLRGSHTELAVVVDEHGGVAGIVTLEDLAEELVGDLEDESDRPAPRAEHHDGGWVVPGAWRLDEVERETGFALPPGEGYDTVSGLVMAELGRVPAVGDDVVVEAGREDQAARARVVVLAMRRWAVERAWVGPAGDGGTGGEP